MTTKAFVGKVFLAVGNGASPEVYTRYCEISDVSGIGVKNDLVEATTFCSEGVKEYIPGLADGNEVTFGANYSMNDSIQEGLMDDVDGKVTRAFELQVDGSSPFKNYKFSLAMLSWDLTPSTNTKNVIKFVGKITGPIVRS